MKPAVLALAVLALLPAAAGAASEIFPTGARPAALTGSGTALPTVAGPVLAGDTVVWAERGADRRFRLRARDAAGVRDLGTIGPAQALSLSAEGERVALGRNHFRTTRRGRTGARLVADEILAGTLTSPIGRLDGCIAGESGCPRNSTPARQVDVAEQAIAFHRMGSGIDVVNFDGDPAGARRSFEGGPAFALAGRFLAVQGPAGANRIDVLDRLTGQLVFSVAGFPGEFDIQADGKLLYGSQQADLAWASPSEPTAHRLSFGSAAPRNEELIPQSRIAGDRVLITNGRDVVLETLSGELRDLPRIRAFHGRDLDFDGRRMAFAVRPCSVVSVVVWEVDDASLPSPPAGPCRPPRMSLPSRRPTRSGRIRIDLTCPPAELLGCPGVVNGGRLLDDIGFYDVEPGRTSRLSLPLSEDARLRLARRGSLTLRLKARTTSAHVRNIESRRSFRIRRR